MAEIGSLVVFTTTEAVRAAIGVDSVDLSDDRIIDAELDIELGLDLASWLPGYSAKLNPGDAPTELQQSIQAALRAYCKWYCASEMLNKVLAYIQVYGDGKADMRRFTNFEWDAVISRAAGKMGTYRTMILDMDPDTPGTYDPNAGYALVGSSAPTYDPVVGDSGNT